jgi:hypothetical protein
VSGAPTLAPVHATAETTRPRALGGWVAGVVLVAGLALATVIVAGDSNVSVGTLRQIHGESAALHEVGGTYVAGWISPQWNPFVDGRFRILTLLVSIVYLTSVTAIGATLIGGIRGVDRWPPTARLLAGFLPGYLIVLAPLQLLFAGISYLTATWITLVALPIVAVVLHRRTLAAGVTGLRSDPEYRRRWLTTAAAIGGILLLCGVHRLQAGRFFMVPDSITAFLQTAGQQMRGVFGPHLAQWDQQSDEWVFNAPLMFTSAHGQDYLFPYYATGFVALASFAALVFGIVHSFAIRRARLAATLAMGAVLASTPAIYPWDQISLIGGQNPTMWLELPGRLVGIVAPWIGLLLIGRQPSRATVAILLATAGLAFTSVSGTAYVVVALVCAGAWHLSRGRGPARLRGVSRAVLVPAFALAALATPVFVYWELHRTETPDELGWVLMAGSGAAACAALLLALTARRPSMPPAPALGRLIPRATLWLGALGLGFILSNNLVGNLADGQVRSTLASVLPGYGLPLETRGIASATTPIAFPRFTGQECQFTGHCVSFPYFLAAYGFLMVLALATWLALGQSKTAPNADPRRAAFLITLGTLVASFALVDFTGADQLTSWVLTRFIEIPYYALLAFAALVLVGSRSRVTAWIGGTVIVAWTVIPLANSHVVPQLARNASYLIKAVN